LGLGFGRGLPQFGQALQASAFEHLAQRLGSDLRVAGGFRGRRRTVDGAGRGRFLDRHLGGGGVFETLVAHGWLMSVGTCGSAMSAVPGAAAKAMNRRPAAQTATARESRPGGPVDQMTISASRPAAKEPRRSSSAKIAAGLMVRASIATIGSRPSLTASAASWMRK